MSIGGTGTARADPSRWVPDYGDALWRFAMSRVRDPIVAEEVLQETFAAALASLGQFRGDSAELTWLTAILRRKLADWARDRNRRAAASIEGETGAEPGGWFGDTGRWIATPGPGGPRNLDAARDPEFLAALKECVTKLPPTLSEAFVLREVHDSPTESVCELLGITPENLWVRIHRARLFLRRCLMEAGEGTDAEK